MGRFMDGLFGPVVTTTVIAGRSETAEQVLGKMDVFSKLCTDCKVSLVPGGQGLDPGSLTIQGRAKRVEKFERLFRIFQTHGLV